MNYIKRNKGTVIAIIIFIVLVVLLFQVKTIFFPNSGKAIYGNRLEGIEEVEISKDTYKKVEKSLAEDSVSKVTTDIAGKLVKIFITVNEDVDLEKAKSYGGKAIEPFTAEQKNYYDFQIYIEKTGDNEHFPIIGYKHHSKGTISWTKDR